MENQQASQLIPMPDNSDDFQSQEFPSIAPGEEFLEMVTTADLKRVEDKVDECLARLDQISTVVGAAYEQVAPTLESLSQHPMLKMFMKGK